MKIKFIAAVLIIVMGSMILAACGGGGGGGGGGAPVNSASNLTADSFSVSSTDNLSDSEFIQKLNNTEDFMYEDGDSGTMDSCLEGKIGNFAFSRNSDNTYRLSITDTDLKECYSDPDVNFNSLIYSLFYDKVIAKDLGGNVVDLEGKKLSDVWNYILTQLVYRSLFIENATFKDTGTPYEATYLGSAHALTDFNDPCVNEGVDNCRIEDVSKVHYIDYPSSDYNDKSVLDMHSLEIVPGAPYYASGTITFTFNNWNGTMTYSDANTAPTYTASNGSTNVSGTYTPPVSPALKADSPQREVKRTIKEMIYRSVNKLF